MVVDYSVDPREKLRKECHEDLAILRESVELPERAFRLLERLTARLDRLETGEFPVTEEVTAPARKGSGTWSNTRVLEALEDGKKALEDGKKE